MTQKEKHKSYFDILLDALSYLAGVIIVAITFIVSWSAITRYLGFRPPLWMFQFTEYALLWFTFLGAAWLLREGGHISIDTIVTRLNSKIQSKLNLFNNVLGFLVSATIFWFGTLHTIDLFQRNIMEVKGAIVPKGPLFLIIPIGGLVLTIQFGRQIISNLKSKLQNVDN